MIESFSFPLTAGEGCFARSALTFPFTTIDPLSKKRNPLAAGVFINGRINQLCVPLEVNRRDVEKRFLLTGLKKGANVTDKVYEVYLMRVTKRVEEELSASNKGHAPLVASLLLHKGLSTQEKLCRVRSYSQKEAIPKALDFCQEVSGMLGVQRDGVLVTRRRRNLIKQLQGSFPMAAGLHRMAKFISQSQFDCVAVNAEELPHCRGRDHGVVYLIRKTREVPRSVAIIESPMGARTYYVKFKSHSALHLWTEKRGGSKKSVSPLAVISDDQVDDAQVEIAELVFEAQEQLIQRIEAQRNLLQGIPFVLPPGEPLFFYRNKMGIMTLMSVSIAFHQGDLRDWLFKQQELTYKDSHILLHAMAEAIRGIHAKGYVHGDIKLAQFLMDDDNLPYLGDHENCGLPPDRAGVCTKRYLSPEAKEAIQSRTYQRTKAADIWALGYVISGMLKGDSRSVTLEILRRGCFLPERERLTAAEICEFLARPAKPIYREDWATGDVRDLLGLSAAL